MEEYLLQKYWGKSYKPSQGGLMAKQQVTVEVSKEAYELAQALFAVALKTKEALKDGWNPLTDVPAVILEAIRVLPGALGGLDQLDDEFKEDPSAFLNAFSLTADQFVGEFLKK